MGILANDDPPGAFSDVDTLVRNYRHWTIHLRRRQVTLGSLVLACKDSAPSMASLTIQAFQELKQVMGETEATLAALFRYDKINYLVLMMVDPQVHFHVIPRYCAPRTFAGVEFTDGHWPMPPDTLVIHETTDQILDRLRDHIRDHWVQDCDQQNRCG